MAENTNYVNPNNYGANARQFKNNKDLKMIFGMAITLLWITGVYFFVMTDKEYVKKREVYLKEQSMANKNLEIEKIKNMSKAEQGKRIQTILNDKYSANLKVDGKVGKNTYNALKKHTDIDKSNLSEKEKYDLASVLLYLEGY